jgi:FkbM family methyltransferase
MNPLSRLRRKISDVRRYPALAWKQRDRRELWLLGLTRHRVLSAGLTARFTPGSRRFVTPRLTLTRGQPVRVEFDRFDQIDSFEEIFVQQIYDLRAVDFEPDLVADCGGFCGYFSTMAAGAFPQARLVCFEANPNNIPLLQAQLDLLEPKVELHATAVHVHDGTVAFSGDSIGGSISGQEMAGDTRSVPCCDFPRWLKTCAPRRFVWKLDVEGAEAGLLPATLAYLPPDTVCYLETHYANDKCEALFGPYRAAGFSIHEIRRRPAAAGNFDYIEWLLKRRA